MIKTLNIITFIIIVGVWTAVAIHTLNQNPTEKLAIIPNINQNIMKMASKDFSKLSDEEKKAVTEDARKNRRKIREVMESKVIPDTVKEQIRKNLGESFRNEMMKQIDEYFSLPESERDAYLDKMMSEMRRGGGPGRGGFGSPPPPGGGENRGQEEQGAQGQQQGNRRENWRLSLSRIKERIESSSPEERAKMSEFRRQIRQKMQNNRENPKQRQ